MAQPRLVVQATNVPIVVPPGKMEYLIGREDPVSNIFPDVDMTPHGGDEGGVGRKHARLTQQAGQWYLEDLNSINGTWVNNQKLRPAAPVPLQNGAELRFGRVKVTFYTQ
jgi:pSer/pThr/pTyr-binding forkhead associated (FHA) protein